MIDSSDVSYSPAGTGAVPTSVLDALKSFAVNALNFLTAAQRAAVVGYTLTDDIRTQLKQASVYATSQGKALYLPAGLWLVEANNAQNTGWTVTVPDNKSLLVFGDGDATIIRRRATTTLAKTSALIWIKANTGINLSFQNLLVDGNEANCPTDSGFTFAGDGFTTIYPYTVADAGADNKLSVTLLTNEVEAIQNRGAFTKSGSYPNRFITFTVAPSQGTKVRLYNIFAHEQSANMKFLPGGGTPNNLTFDNVAMTGCVGDGFHANVHCQSLQVSNWRSFGRTRRPRADIQLSRIPLQATNVTNFIGDAFESEPSGTNAEHIINLSNMLVRGALDLAGDNQHFANVNAINVMHLCRFGVGLPFSNFYKVRGKFVNCSFVGTNRIQRSQVEFKGGRFTIFGLTLEPAIADDIKIWHDLANNFVEFNDVAFDFQGRVTSGTFVSASVATADASRETRFINCRTTQKLDYFARANRCGTMLLDGGQIGGSIATVSIENGGTGNPAFITNVILKNPERWASGLASIGVVSGPVRVEMFGYFDAERLEPTSNTTPGMNAHITWIGGFTASVASDPNGRICGLPGLIMRKSEPAAGEITEWRYQNGETYASNVYDAVVTNIKGSATYNPPGLVDGSGATTTVTATGATLGDFAEASFSKDLQGITVTAWVSATNIVSVRFQNETGGTVDLANGTLRVHVRKP